MPGDMCGMRGQRRHPQRTLRASFLAQAPVLWPEVFQETGEKYVLVASTHHVRLLICEARFVQSACHVAGRQGLCKFVAL